MDQKNTSVSANATPENSVPSETKKKQKNRKTTKKGAIHSQVVKLLVGDEIAQIAIRCKPILGNKSAEVGEMLAEKLAAHPQNFRSLLLESLNEIERNATPGGLSKEWVEWREDKARAQKAEEERRKLEAEERRQAKKGGNNAEERECRTAQPVTPSVPEFSESGSEAGPADLPSSVPDTLGDMEYADESSTERPPVEADESPEGAR